MDTFQKNKFFWLAYFTMLMPNRYVDSHCSTIMSPKWYKSFKFKEFDKEMLEKENFEGCEKIRLHQLNL
jgi:hypothetical protein